MVQYSNKQVFIVDDDQFLLNMYSVKFKKFGFLVDTVAGGQEALDKIREGAKPDVLLLDVVMPSMNGIEFLEHIRKEKLIPNAVVIVLSNQNQSEDIEKANNLGIAGYIVKANSIPSEVVSEVIRVLAAAGK